MKTVRLIALACWLTLAVSCSEDEEAQPESPDTAAGSAVIGSEQFQPSETNVFLITSGLELKLKEGIQEVNLRLDDDIAGTYVIQNSSPEGRTKSMEGRGEYIDREGKIYYAESGTVTVSQNVDGTISGTFSLSLKSAAGQKVSISEGAIRNIAITAMDDVCRLSGISDTEQPDRMTFKYDGEGKLIEVRYDDSGEITYVDHYLFTYVGGKLAAIRHVFHYDQETSYYQYDVGYTNDMITSVSGNGPDAYTFRYSQKTLTGGTHRYDGGEVRPFTFGYDAFGNITSYAAPGYKADLEAYDAKKNYGQILIEALQGQPALLYIIDGSPALFSVNNPMREVSTWNWGSETDALIYEYNVQEYPVSITRHKDGELVEVTTLIYSSCK